MKNTFLLAFLVTALTSGSFVHAELIIYSYDGAGRLTGVNYGSGKSTSYLYDTSGNLKRAANIGASTAQSALVADTDSDGDGIADAWEMHYFGKLNHNASGDLDGDGFSDLSEYVAGTDPSDPNSLLRVSQDVTHDGTQTTVRWGSVAGKTYRVQYKDGIAATEWTDLPGDVTATASESSKVDATSTGTLRFYRVMVFLE